MNEGNQVRVLPFFFVFHSAAVCRSQSILLSLDVYLHDFIVLHSGWGTRPRCILWEHVTQTWSFGFVIASWCTSLMTIKVNSPAELVLHSHFCPSCTEDPCMFVQVTFKVPHVSRENILSWSKWICHVDSHWWDCAGTENSYLSLSQNALSTWSIRIHSRGVAPRGCQVHSVLGMERVAVQSLPACNLQG